MAKITVQDTEINIIAYNEDDYISLTDMVRSIENGLALIEKWLRNKNTIEFLGIWEEMYNPDFNSLEFGGIKNEAGANRFILSVKQWVEKTNSKGLIAKAGRYGGTYAHKDIAFEFASWVSPQFKLYLLKEFQRLKAEEQAQIGWSVKRELARINYHIHTGAIKANLIPAEVTPASLKGQQAVDLFRHHQLGHQAGGFFYFSMNQKLERIFPTLQIGQQLVGLFYFSMNQKLDSIFPPSQIGQQVAGFFHFQLGHQLGDLFQPAHNKTNTTASYT